MEYVKEILRSENEEVFIEGFYTVGEKRPAIIVCPGGAYRTLAPYEGKPVAEAFIKDGFNAFVLYYSLNENAVFPKPVVDAARAINFVRKNADKFCVYKDQIAILGFSAGGHVAATASTLFNNETVLKETGLKKEDIIPNGTVLCYPVTSTKYWMDYWKIGEKYSGGDKEILKLANTPENITPETPPCYIWSTFSDDAVPVEESVLYIEGLLKNEVPFESHIFSNGRHGLGLAEEHSDIKNWQHESALFLKKAFNNELTRERAGH